VAISLGKDCSLAFDGSAVPGVRDVTVDTAGETIAVNPFATRANASYSTGYMVSIVVDTIDDSAASAAQALAISGGTVTVTATGLPSGVVCVVADVSDGQPLEGVRGFSIRLEQSMGGLR